MRTALLTLPIALLPSLVFADCGNDQPIFSCSIGKRVLEICHDRQSDVFSYSYGPAEQPELSLWEQTAHLDFKPWPGVSSAIWESVTFNNDTHSYEVWTSIPRDPEDNSGRSGGVNVLKGETVLASLTCDPGTASQSLDVIYEIKTEFGQCWNFETHSWAESCN